jgi:hypothetical protein
MVLALALGLVLQNFTPPTPHVPGLIAQGASSSTEDLSSRILLSETILRELPLHYMDSLLHQAHPTAD